MKAPFPITPELTAIAVKYRNPRLIADQVLPRVPVGLEEFKYWKFTLADGFTLPDTKVGRKSKPNEVEFSATEQTDSTGDYGLDDPVPQKDIDQGRAMGFDPLGHATMTLTDLIALDREVRAAALVFNPASYAAANKVVLAGATQWSDVASDPIAAIMTGLDACIMRPNKAVFGRATWTKLIQHPKIVKATNRNDGDAGVASRRAVAELFELEEILVGEGFVNTAKKGQAPAMARVWGKHAALICQNGLATATNGLATYGYTAQYGTRVAGAVEDRDIGLRGGQRVRVGESVKELIVANDLAYFFENAVA
jgi:hypothetical protein